jgi:hypothetical protein
VAREKADHGNNARYNDGCRCRACKDGHAVYEELYRIRSAALPDSFIAHGTLGAYDNYKCRCDPCKAAKSRAHAEQYRRQKDEKEQRKAEERQRKEDKKK